jgi:hypothetical protein
MAEFGKLPREGTKDRAKLDAMARRGLPCGASLRELQDIDDSKGKPWGTYKNDGARYAEMLGGTLRIWGSGPSTRYWIETP